MKRGRKTETRRKDHSKSIGIVIIAVIELIVFLSGYMLGSFTNKKEVPVQKPEEVVNNEVPVIEEEIKSFSVVDDIINEMSLDDMIYQMLFVTPEAITGVETATRAGDSTKNALKDYPVGGIIYFEKNYESDDQFSEMIRNSQSYSKTPLFIGADKNFEENKELGFNIDLHKEIIPDYKNAYLNSDDGYSESDKTLDELKSEGISKDAEFIMISHMNLPNATTKNVNHHRFFFKSRYH